MKRTDDEAGPGSSGGGKAAVPSFAQRPILLVEDSEEEAHLMRSAFKRAGIANPLEIVSTGEDAMARLARLRRADPATHVVPAAMWLDVKLPRMDGFETLAWARRQPHLREMVIVVLSAFARPQDADRAYNLGANHFLTKPALFDEWVGQIKRLCDWLTRCHLNKLELQNREKLSPGRREEKGR